ncbi:soluble methane monooxygenase-binding protein MmoD [Candidatus Methylospira mobilis]|nr:soluble methane monooxygenase-binding protein MmoD [Candidatus Methylospira mobilis]WNV03797.1 soluble methane monooxygenase-binding protein MmoD [Candidatus Methylospira mobilis]
MMTTEDHSDSKVLDLEHLFQKNLRGALVMPEGLEPVPLIENGRYSAYAYDLDFMWRWVITRDGEEIQDGCAISLESSKQSVQHVLAFFGHVDGQIMSNKQTT